MSADDKQPIPGFRIIDKLGAGGMGAVYRAVQISLEREIAIKVMPSRFAKDAESKERFFREARAAGRLNHPNIVQGIDAGEAGKYCWIAMELVEGSSVEDLLREKGSFSPDEALKMVTDIARGLEHAAEADIVHRDVKPGNFLLSNAGVTKLCDLGIAKGPSDSALTQDGRAVGTPRYISPEQARGEHDIDARADIYALGASWYHMVSGKLPFTGETSAVIMTKHLNETAEPIQKLVPRLPAHHARVIEKMMQKAPDDRHLSMADLLLDLEALKNGEAPPKTVGKGKDGSVRPSGMRTGAAAKGQAGARSTKAARAGRKSSGGRGHAEKKSGPPVVLILEIVAVLVVVLVIVLSRSSDALAPRRPATPKPGPVAAPKAPTTSSRKTPTQATATTAKPSAEKKAEKAWKKLLRNAERIPGMEADLLESFIKKYRQTTFGKMAIDRLEKMDAKLSAEMEEAARDAYRDLQQGGTYDKEAQYIDYLNRFPASRYAKEVTNRLARLREAREARVAATAFVGIPKDNPGEALKGLRIVAEGRGQGHLEDVVRYLKHKRADLRIASMQAAARMDRNRGLRAGMDGLTDKNQLVRLAAIKVLSDYRDKRVAAALNLIAEDDPSEGVRAAAKAAAQPENAP